MVSKTKQVALKFLENCSACLQIADINNEFIDGKS